MTRTLLLLAALAAANPAPRHRPPVRPPLHGEYKMSWRHGTYAPVVFWKGHYEWGSWSGTYELAGDVLTVRERAASADPNDPPHEWAATLTPGKLSGRLADGSPFALEPLTRAAAPAGPPPAPRGP